MEVSSSLSEENADKLEIICKILNESGAWEKVADMWDCAHVISSARDSPNPSKFIFQTVEVTFFFLYFIFINPLTARHWSDNTKARLKQILP